MVEGFVYLLTKLRATKLNSETRTTRRSQDSALAHDPAKFT